MTKLVFTIGITLGVALGLRAEEPAREEVRAPDGRLLYAREPGESPNSERVFDQGTWMTRVFEKADKRLLRRVESAREEHEFTYEGDRVVSRKVRLGESEFSVSLTPSGFVQATGLPSIKLELDAEGNLVAVLDERGPLAKIRSRPSGRHLEILLRGQQRLVTRVEENRAWQTLNGERGQVLYSGDFALDANGGEVSKFSFDLIHDDLGLTATWSKGLRLEPAPTGFSDAIRREGEDPVAWIVRGIPVGRGVVDVVCRADGRPVAWEISAVGMMGETPAAPWRIQVTPDRGVSLAAPNGPPGRVLAIWYRGNELGFRVGPRPPAAGDLDRSDSRRR